MNSKCGVIGFLSVVLCSVSALAVEDGTAANPYLIGNEGDLAKITDYGMGTEGQGVHFALTQDFALSSPWAGIGTYAKTNPTVYFSGILDGQGHKISNVAMASGSVNNYRGFFNQIVGGTVRNLTIATTGFGATPPAGEHGCAALAGAAYNALIEGCTAEGTITATHNAGGLVVRMKDTTIRSCTNKVNVTGSYTKVGGICVISQETVTGDLIEGCVNEGVITAANESNAGSDGVGGIIAYVCSGNGKMTIRDCENKGAVIAGPNASASAKVGQFVGYQFTPAVVDNCLVDITAVVRSAGKGTTTLETGTLTDGSKWPIDNAFGCGEANADRIMLKTAYNRIDWTIADDFDPGRPVVVTRYTIKRTSPDSNTPSPYGEKRAPTVFYLQGSNDGTNWTNVDYQRAVNWTADVKEKTFTIDPRLVASYRRYRFITVVSNADSGTDPLCAFQYVKLMGTFEPGDLTGRTVDHIALNTNTNNNFVTGITPTLDSKVEFDISFGSVSGTQGIFASNYSGNSPHFRLFMINGVWSWRYGTSTYNSTIKALPQARYHVVVDGPVVTVNGTEVINAGTKLTTTAELPLTLFATYGASSEGQSKRYNFLSKDTKLHSFKVADGNGKVVLDLEPVATAAGGALRDKATGIVHHSDIVVNRLVNFYRTEDSKKSELDMTGDIRDGGYSPVVTLVEGSAHASYPETHLFTRDDTNAGRALFDGAVNTIQYDVPDDYKPGWPVVLTRYALLPCVGDQSDRDSTAPERAPSRFRLEGSKDGETWVTLQEQSETDVSFGCYVQGPLSAAASDGKQGFKGVYVEIPEENRGDYRHYRFTSLATRYTGGYKMGLQEIRFFGYVGGFEQRQDPVAYVQNNASTYTYFNTDLKPASSDLTIEMTGEFTDVSQTECLFCSRTSSGSASESFTLFLINGAFRFDCGQQGTATTFKPVANREYRIKVENNNLYVDGELQATTGSGATFAPGGVIALMASYGSQQNGNPTGWGNQARFKLKSCRIKDATGAIARDYVPVVRSDAVVGLHDRVTGWFKPSGDKDPVAGPAADVDFRQREREVRLVTETAGGPLPDGPLTFAFSDNQRVGGKLYAAFDNHYCGNSTNGWAKVVELADVRTGVDLLEIAKPENPEKYHRVKFFVCDSLGRGVSQTRTYKAGRFGTMFIIR